MSLWCDDFYVTPQGYYVNYKQGYYIKVYQGYYVTMTLTNHRTFQNRPTLDAKKMHFCSSESRESRIFGISPLKTIVLKNKTKLFFRPATGQLYAGICRPEMEWVRYPSDVDCGLKHGLGERASQWPLIGVDGLNRRLSAIQSSSQWHPNRIKSQDFPIIRYGFY